MKIGIAIIHFALIFYFVYVLEKRWRVTNKKLFWSAFLVRLIAGITVGLIYTYYYSANDTWLFFEEAGQFSTSAQMDFASYLWALVDVGEKQNWPGLINHDWRTVFFIKIISPFWLLSKGNYWVCAAYFSFFAFVFSWRLHQKVIAVFPGSLLASAMAFLFLPSVIFWSSGLEKESLSLCGVYFLAILFIKLMKGERLLTIYWVGAIPVCFLVWTLKYYWVAIFFIATFAALFFRFINLRFSLSKNYLIATWGFVFLGIGILLTFTHPNFYLSRFLEVIVSNHNEFVAISSPKNLIHYYHFNESWLSVAVNSPWALFSGLFRPLIGEGQGILGLSASVENIFLFLFFISSLRNLKKSRSISNQIVLLSVISYCVVMVVFLALSTPNFGTLSRYRVGFLPFFVFLITYRNVLINWITKKMGFTLV